MSNPAPIETSPYIQPASERTPTITMARLLEWFEGEVVDLKAQAQAAPAGPARESFMIRAGQVRLMHNHMQAETLRALDQAKRS